MEKFDLTTVYNEDRPMSWSGISSFEWRPSGWYAKYVVHGKCTRFDEAKGKVDFCFVVMAYDPECPVIKKTPELEFGSYIDKKIQDDPTFLPDLVRFPVLQHEMRAVWNGIPLLGFADTYRPPDKYRELGMKSKLDSPAIRDYKTGRKPWDQKRADETGQLTMYLFMLYLADRKIDIDSAELYIDWLPTHIQEGKIAFIEPVKIHTFKTKRSMVEVLKFGKRIEETWAAMEAYATQQQGSVVHSRGDW